MRRMIPTRLLLLCVLAAAAAAPAAAQDDPPAARALARFVLLSPAVGPDDGRDERAFARRVRAAVDAARADLDFAGPKVLVFPEDVGLVTAFAGWQGAAARRAPTFAAAAQALGLARLPQVMWYRREGVSEARALLLASTDALWRPFVRVFADCARAEGAYVIACTNVAPARPAHSFFEMVFARGPRAPFDGGGAWLPDGTDVFNTAVLFDPAGRIVGTQRKVHLIPMEQATYEVDGRAAQGLDLTPAPLDDLRVFETPAGRLGIAICWDGFHDDVLARLHGLGAEVIIQPSANPQPWCAPAGAHPWQPEDWNGSVLKSVTNSAWPGLRYHLCAMLRGRLADVIFDGQSAATARTGGSGGGYAGNAPDPHFLAVAPWPADPADSGAADPVARRPALAAAARRFWDARPGPDDPAFRRGAALTVDLPTARLRTAP